MVLYSGPHFILFIKDFIHIMPVEFKPENIPVFCVPISGQRVVMIAVVIIVASFGMMSMMVVVASAMVIMMVLVV